MTTAYTSLLGLALPVTGELSGTWGDTVNNSITSLLDSAVAGTTTLSTDADVTLTTTTGASNQARQAILLCSGARTALRTITAPAQSKIYTVINATTGGYSVKVVGVGPTTGVTIVAGESAVIAWNGSDFIKVSNTSGAGVFTSLTDSGLTSGRVTYATTGGLLTDASNFTFDGTTLTVPSASHSGNLTFTGTGNRITGDFSNATHANRVSFQTSTVNGATSPFFIPNGTGSIASIVVANASDPTNSSYGQVSVVGTTDFRMVSGSLGTGTYLPMTFYTGGSERMRLDTSGNLGIGTSSPGARLDVNGGRSYFAANSEPYSIYLRYNSSTAGFYIGSPSADTMTFSVSSGSEKMRIDSSGNLLVGTTSSLPSFANGRIEVLTAASSYGLVIDSTDSSSSGIGIRGNNSTVALSFYNASSAATVGTVVINSSSTSYNTSSDYRLKEDVAPMTGALDTVAQLKPVTYKWKADGSDGQGFIAHELQAVVPECVTGEKDELDDEGNPRYQGIDTSFLVATLTAAIQEQSALIQSLTDRITQLESKGA